MLKVIIAGGRDYIPQQKHKQQILHLLSNHSPKEIEIVSGGARGADKFGEDIAKEMGYNLSVFKADWDKHGKAAGYIRNAEMKEYSDCLIALWDSESRGTANMIEQMMNAGKPVRIIYY